MKLFVEREKKQKLLCISGRFLPSNDRAFLRTAKTAYQFPLLANDLELHPYLALRVPTMLWALKAQLRLPNKLLLPIENYKGRLGTWVSNFSWRIPTTLYTKRPLLLFDKPN